MSRFDDIVAEKAGLLLEVGGRSITYEAADTDAVTLVAVVGDEQVERVAGPDGDQIERVRMIDVPRAADAAGGYVADPQRYARVIVDTETFVVERITSQSAAMATLRCVHLDTYQVRREGYR
jgi:hypothetical protein